MLRQSQLSRPLSAAIIGILTALLPFAAHAQEGPAVNLHKWSGKINVPDPVAISVAPNGDVYVSATTRRKVADLDIREHRDWIPDDVALDSVEAKREFLKRELAPGKLRQPRGGLADHNKDGSIDWKDLTVHTERIYQLRDTNGDGTADRITVFAEGFNTEVTGIAAGVLYHDGWVYATIAPDLWRLKDTDGDGVADLREVVAHGFGLHIAYAGHDMHGPRLGPDGRIYWSIGDKGVNVTSKEGKKFYYPHQGAVLRVEPDGRNFEVFAHGLRNVQETAFDQWGNLFGVDNDADMKGEKERVVHIVEGSDSGWRCGHQYMSSGKSRWMRENLWKPAHAGQPLHLLPPIALSHNGPAGFLWEPGTALDDNLRGKFFLSQFPSGDISALTLEPTGASFKLTGDSLLTRGIMAIGMAWHPDGSIFFADWDGGYPLDEKGGVWQINTAKNSTDKTRQKVHDLLRNGFSKTTPDALISLLAHADQRVRIEAQLELVKRQQWSQLQTIAFDRKTSELARVHAIWGLGIGLRLHDLKAEPLLPLLSDSSDHIRAQTAKILGDAPASLKGDEAAKLIPLLSDQDAPTRLQTAIALGKFKFPGAIEPLIEFAHRDASDPVLRHAASYSLAGCAQPQQLTNLSKHASLSVRASALLALWHQRSPEITIFLRDQDTAIIDEAARSIHDDQGIPAALPALAALSDRVSSLSLMTQRRALNAAFILGGKENAQRLITAALNPNLSKEIRLEAWNYLASWTNPPRLDLVDGTARDLSKRNTEGASETVASQVDALLALKDAELKTAGILALVNLKVPVSVSVLQVIINDRSSPGQVRAEALNLLADQHADAPEVDTTLKDIWSGKEVPVEIKTAAITIIATKRPDTFPDRLARILQYEKNTGLQQQALALAKTVPQPVQAAIAPTIEEWMTRLNSGSAHPALQLDLLETAEFYAATAPSIQKQLTLYEAARPAPAIGASGIPVLPSPKELLHGGDIQRGRDIVSNHLAANCIACHIAESTTGSNVGPTLVGIGKLHTREYLLDSLLQPAATIAPGFGTVSLTLKDGTSTAGTLLEETSQELKIRTGDGKTQTFDKTNITFQTPPISIMPPMLGILTKREIRDVVEYLASLQKPKK
ncbi:c-type cytochrome [Phragmitibacter flavus]|uniref:C-type cytochrome n=1 Tax=Phragmitibacter flavus TaxID=2576071 RepID=A0A5R8KBI5_9BACT|nr:PVC-type heme-binding CxxCH protein [Phragmitibacter flavus]TLD69670.1 c-type cytochrome [Phragmitibacter flavus]